MYMGLTDFQKQSIFRPTLYYWEITLFYLLHQCSDVFSWPLMCWCKRTSNFLAHNANFIRSDAQCQWPRCIHRWSFRYTPDWTTVMLYRFVSGLSARVPECQKLNMSARPGWMAKCNQLTALPCKWLISVTVTSLVVLVVAVATQATLIDWLISALLALPVNSHTCLPRRLPRVVLL